MPYTFEQSRNEIARLVKDFTTHRSRYLTSSYKEAHARQEFIDPLFGALNWDVHNSQHTTPDYREVTHEDSLDVAGHKKAPDYAFRLGGNRKFFVEAKKPGVDLKNAAGPAYQLRRYAWSAKLPLSILTDFEELAVYDCPIRPINFSDPADKARHDKMAALVEQMLDLHKRRAEAPDAAGQERLQRLIDATDRQIDTLVYELYGLTEAEAKIVEAT